MTDSTKRAEETTPQREQRLKANRELQKQKRAEENTPQSEQRLKANRELQTPFCVKFR